METYTFRRANPSDKENIIAFMNLHWDIKHPLVNLPDFFDYYYAADDGMLNFILAEQHGRIAALAGYIPASSSENPDIWVSLWVADKGAKGSGLELMAALPEVTGCSVLACNNIRPETRAFYEFLGYTTGRVGHYYRLADRENFSIACIKTPLRPKTGGKAVLELIETPDELIQCGFKPSEGSVPHKDLWYIRRRYFNFPRQKYDLWAVKTESSALPLALLATRTVPVGDSRAIRIVDFIGEADTFAELGGAIDLLIESQNAEYADMYCVGILESTMLRAGFVPRKEQDENIIPNYLTPILRENIDFYYFTSKPENFTLFKADGDQDRPNISVD